MGREGKEILTHATTRANLKKQNQKKNLSKKQKQNRKTATIRPLGKV